MDNGYPQILAADVLKLYITQQGVKSELDSAELQVRGNARARAPQ